MKKWLSLALPVLLTACNPAGLGEKLADAEKVQVARAYVQRLMDGDVAGLAAELDPALRTGKEVEQLNAMRAAIPAGTPTTTEVVGYQSNRTADSTGYNVTFQFGYGEKWVVINAAWRESAGASRVITGMRAVPQTQSLQEANAFGFRHAGLKHYLVLAAAVLVPLFTLLTFVTCLRTRLPRNKWLWAFFVLVGFGQFSLNWTTGETAMTPVALQLFGAGVMTSNHYAPWIISVSLPLGAVVFWFKRRQLRKEPPPAACAMN